MVLGLDNSVKLHQSEFFEFCGKVTVLNSLSGTCRIVASVGLMSLHGILLLIHTPLALGEMAFTDKTRFQREAEDDIRVIFYNVMQILHGVIDVIPVIGNIPYWIKSACKQEGEQPVHLPSPPVEFEKYYSLINFHQNDFLEVGGSIPVASSFTGVCRIVAAINIICFQGAILAIHTPLALGEMVFTDNTRFQREAVDDVRVIFHNAMQILHGVIDMIPLIGNIPYWIKTVCKDEQNQINQLPLPLPPPPVLVQ